MKKICFTLLLCLTLGLGWCQTFRDSTEIVYSKKECDTIFLLTVGAIDNKEIETFPQDKMVKLRTILCDCFVMYNFISIQSSVVKYYFKNINGYPLK